VDKRFRTRGLGHALLYEALKITLRVADEVGCRCIITDAYPDKAGWYGRYGHFSFDDLRGEVESISGGGIKAESPVMDNVSGVSRPNELILLVDAVGIEPTTCRLRAECSAS
jgi:hypothetical protein